MASPQAQPIHWSEDKYKELEGQLEGFWAQDEWDMSKCPLATEDMMKSRSNCLRKIHFDCMSPLKNEIKYACWQKFQNKEWSITTVTTINCVNAVVEWLNTIAIKTSSLLQKELKQWELSMRSYLVERGRGVMKRTYGVIDSNQTRKMVVAESNCISTFRQFYKVIQAAYDDVRIQV